MINWWKELSTKHPWRVIAATLVVLVVAGWYGFGLFDNISTSEQFAASGTESMRAKDQIEKSFGASPLTEVVMFERKDASLGEVTSTAYQAELAKLLEPLRSRVEKITTYSDQPSEAFVSKDKTSTYALVVGKGDSKQVHAVLSDYERSVDQSRLRVLIGGNSVVSEQMNEVVGKDLVRAEMITLPILLVLLLFFFGSVTAALVPLGLSLVTVLGAFALTRLMTHFVGVDQYAINVITILGLGLSIDYALLSVNRFREELAKGGVARAVRIIIDTSGRTIFFSGITVMACMLALLVFPLEFLHSIAIGGASAIAIAMLVTVVVLPSVLMVLGQRIDLGKLHFIPKRKTEPKFWVKVAEATTGHPVIASLTALVFIALAVIPLSHLNLTGTMDYKYLAVGTSGQQVAQKMAEDFSVQSPSISGVVTGLQNVNTHDKLAIACRLTAEIKNQPGVKEVISAAMIPQGMTCSQYQVAYQAGMLPPQLMALIKDNLSHDALRFSIVVNGKVGGEQAEQALLAIRAISPEKGEWIVGGMEAYSYDTNKAYMDSIPYAAAIIAVSMFVLLTLLLASLAIPLQAIVINLISLAISFTVLVGVFQLGWLGIWYQVDEIVMTPLVLIATIAFGLAMDYSVFLYSRMYEVYEKTGDSSQAIRQGIIKTGPIITAAALMVFAVVVAFASSGVVIMQMIGLGLAVAVLVDAFFVRLLLVPSVMTLMGKLSWYAPKWVKALRIKHE